MIGGDGDDVLGGFAEFGFDAFVDEAGNDVLVGGAGADLAFGGDGNDFIDGGAGADRLYGGAGNDEILGGAGADVLYGGSGVDFLTGGADADVFGVDGLCDDQFSIITDFNAAAGDRLRIDGGGVFLGLVIGDYDGDGQADDTLLGFAGGNVVVFGVAGLGVDDWNALLV